VEQVVRRARHSRRRRCESGGRCAVGNAMPPLCSRALACRAVGRASRGCVCSRRAAAPAHPRCPRARSRPSACGKSLPGGRSPAGGQGAAGCGPACAPVVLAQGRQEGCRPPQSAGRGPPCAGAAPAPAGPAAKGRAELAWTLRSPAGAASPAGTGWRLQQGAQQGAPGCDRNDQAFTGRGAELGVSSHSPAGHAASRLTHPAQP
jgi:hypothetical protein